MQPYNRLSDPDLDSVPEMDVFSAGPFRINTLYVHNVDVESVCHQDLTERRVRGAPRLNQHLQNAL